MNSVSIIGRLTKNPELRFTKSGTAVTNLRLARNERYGEKEQPLYVDIKIWGRQAETVATHKKVGDQIAVAGRLEYSEYTDAEGRRHNRLCIVAHSIEFLARKNGNGHDKEAEAAAQVNGDPATQVEEHVEEEIPF